MQSRSASRICIFANCIAYGVVILSLFRGILQRSQDLVWLNTEMHTMRLLYDVTFIGIMAITILVTIGLVRLKSWGRYWAIVWNIVIAFLLIGLRLFGYLFLIGLSGAPPEGIVYFNADTILQWVCGALLLLLAICYRHRAIKELFH
jgi:hypothetical protein